MSEAAKIRTDVCVAKAHQQSEHGLHLLAVICGTFRIVLMDERTIVGRQSNSIKMHFGSSWKEILKDDRKICLSSIFSLKNRLEED